MKSKLRIVLCMTLMSLFVCSISAQRSSSSPKEMDVTEMAEKQAKNMKEALNLTVEQEAKIKEICLKYNKKMKEKREKASENRNQREEMKVINDDRNAEIKEVLTPEQNEKWEAKQKEREKNRKGGRDKRGKR